MHRFALLFFAVSAHLPALAEPRVGEQATYTVTTTHDGKAVSSTRLAEIVQFDDATHRYLERETHKVPGQPDQVQDTWKGAAELLTDEKIEGILEDCSGAGGDATEISVPAGLFHACIMPVKADDMQPLSGRVWIARVPFGIAHAEFDQGGSLTVLDLHDYQEP